MQLFYDQDIIVLKHNDDFYVYSPVNHTRIVINQYSHYLVEQILKENGFINVDTITSNFNNKFSTELKTEEILEQVERLVQMEIFFHSNGDLHNAKNKTIERFKIVDKVPTLAYLLLTYRCNFSCSYCYLRDTNQDVRELTTEQWKKVINKLKKLGVKKFAITGGEPLMREDLVEILKECKKDDAHVALLTNGSLLKERFDEVDPLIDNIILSFDSFDEKINTLNRSSYGYNEIKELIELYSRLAPDKIQVRAVITKHNMGQVDEFAKRINEEYGIKTIRTLVNPIRPEEVELVPDMTGKMAIDNDRIDSLSYAMKISKMWRLVMR